MNTIKRLKDWFSSPPKEEVYELPAMYPSYTPMVRTLPENFKVRMVEEYDKNGYLMISPEPGLDELESAEPNFSDLDRLIWHAAVVTANTGLRVDVTEGYSTVNGIRQNDHYHISIPGSSTSLTGFHETWRFLSGIEMGAEALLQRQKYETTEG